MSLSLVTRNTPALQAICPSWYRPPAKRKYNFLERSVAITGVPVEGIQSDRRFRHLVRTRWAIAHVLRDSLNWSYGEIGHCLRKDHSTIIYAVQQSRELVKVCADHSNLVDALEMVA